MAAAQVDNSLKNTVDDSCVTVNPAQVRLVRMQHVECSLWACFPNQEFPKEREYPVVVDDLQYDAFEVWILSLADPTLQYYYIQNLGSGRYAWVQQSPLDGDVVTLPTTKRLWQILPTVDGYYKITPAGVSPTNYFWTLYYPYPQASVVDMSENATNMLGLWRFQDIDEDILCGNLTSVVKIQQVSTKLWATAPTVPDGFEQEMNPVVVAPDNLDKDIYENWKLTKVNREWLERDGGIIAGHIHGGNVEEKVVGPYYTIQNLGTMRYARESEPLEMHTKVYQSDAPRVWKIIHAADGHYIISPAGQKEDELFWTAVRDVRDETSPIRLEKPSGKPHHWIIKAVNRNTVPRPQTGGEGAVGHGIAHH
ncbi:hypothetical protein BC835DRAFT_1425066 [Cytidiella melzeri]|nr:hypothetical protein BC835DRAFT_1425066 [Cytidiella melzeri]